MVAKSGKRGERDVGGYPIGKSRSGSSEKDLLVVAGLGSLAEVMEARVWVVA